MSVEVHNSNATALLQDEKDKGESFYVNSAYSVKSQEEIIENRGMENKVCEKRIQKQASYIKTRSKKQRKVSFSQSNKACFLLYGNVDE
jgi:hypothetical protein